MAFDPLTLVTASLLICATVAGLLLLTWLQNRQVVALAWWSGAFLLASLGFVLLLLGAATSLSPVRVAANAVVATAYGLSYAAGRIFNGRSPRWALALSGGIVWLVACWGIGISPAGRMTLSSLLIGSYTFAIAYELWFGARERLLAQRAAALLCVVHGFYFVLRLVSGPTLLRSVPWVEDVDSAWGMVMGVETLLYVTGFGFLILSMSKERLEHGHRRAASLDPLTGVANRRAFREEAEALLARNRARRRASSVIMFDLDHFKDINDRHGHDAGDRILLEFCNLASRQLGRSSSFCRMGGEEFAAFLSGSGVAEASKLAERIRASFADRPIMIGGEEIHATVSIGISGSSDSGMALGDLLTHADAALYAAKRSGRNRVCVHEAHPAAAVAEIAVQPYRMDGGDVSGAG